MAEAIVNARIPGWSASSAGTHPQGYVHPMVVQVLQEIGISHSGTSKSVELFRGNDFDLVITVCDSADKHCAAWRGGERRLHAGYPDPFVVGGSPEQQVDAYRKVRDAMLRDLPLLLR